MAFSLGAHTRAHISPRGSPLKQTRPHLRKALMSSDANTVPATFQQVQHVFFRHPSAAMPAAAIAGLVLARLQHPFTLEDIAVAAGVVLFWLLQEWIVHKFLLHSSFDWMGKTIHHQHHETPYFHVSLDPPELILSVMALAAVAFTVLFKAGPLSLTATAAYYSAGLLYEWLHYVVHTRWVPPSGWRGAWLRAVRRHHMLHHMRNEDYWLSFSAPAVDALFGTLPASGTSVPLSSMAKRAHGVGAAAAAAAAAGADGGSSSSRGLQQAAAAAVTAQKEVAARRPVQVGSVGAAGRR